MTPEQIERLKELLGYDHDDISAWSVREMQDLARALLAEWEEQQARLAKVVEIATDAIDRVASCPKGSIGAIGNVHLCQIGTDEVIRWRVALAASQQKG